MTDGWFNQWKKRYGLAFSTLHGEAAEADVESANKWRTQNITELLESYSPSESCNADETAFYFRALPNSTYITLLVCCCMTGENVQPLVFGKFAKPRCMKNVSELPLPYQHSANAWITKVIWQEWLESWDKNLRRQVRKIALLVDNNCSARMGMWRT